MSHFFLTSTYPESAQLRNKIINDDTLTATVHMP
jgi:hypothetical protein